MKAILKQKVKNFNDEETLVEQIFMIDDYADEKWVIIKHDTQEISLSLENWNKLVEMANKLINKN
jgi:hypothetical protein